MEEALKDFWIDTQNWKRKLDPILGNAASPTDVMWDTILPPKPLFGLFASGVLFSLLAYPSRIRYRRNYPLHLIFFAFNVAALIVNVSIFMNSLVIYHSRSSIIMRLLSLVVSHQTVLSLTWIYVGMKFFEFIGEALDILREKHDNYRSIKITWFMIRLLNIWLVLREGAPPLLSFDTLSNFIFNWILDTYCNFEPSLHLSNPELLAMAERIVCALEIGEIINILLRLLPPEDDVPTDPQFSREFRIWILVYGLLAVIMLSIVRCRANVYIRDNTTRMRQAQSTVGLSNYGYTPSENKTPNSNVNGDAEN